MEGTNENIKKDKTKNKIFKVKMGTHVPIGLILPLEVPFTEK